MKLITRALLGILSLSSVLGIPLEAQSCPNCDCYQYPLPSTCVKCCSVATGKLESFTDSSVTVQTSGQTNKETPQKFVVTPKTRKNAKLEKGSLVTVYFRRDGNIAEQIDMVSALDGLMLPAALKDPPVPSSCGTIPPDAFRVYVGDSLGWSVWPEMTVIKYLNIPVVRIRRTMKGIVAEVHLFEPDGRPSAVIVDNRLYLNPNGSFHLKRPNGYSLALYDKDDILVFAIQYLNAHTVAIIGKFDLPGFPGSLLVAPHGIVTTGTRNLVKDLCSENPDPMFEVSPQGFLSVP
jgi:hypothetical protein